MARLRPAESDVVETPATADSPRVRVIPPGMSGEQLAEHEGAIMRTDAYGRRYKLSKRGRHLKALPGTPPAPRSVLLDPAPPRARVKSTPKAQPRPRPTTSAAPAIRRGDLWRFAGAAEVVEVLSATAGGVHVRPKAFAGADREIPLLRFLAVYTRERSSEESS